MIKRPRSLRIPQLSRTACCKWRQTCAAADRLLSPATSSGDRETGSTTKPPARSYKLLPHSARTPQAPLDLQVPLALGLGPFLDPLAPPAPGQAPFLVPPALPDPPAAELTPCLGPQGPLGL